MRRAGALLAVAAAICLGAAPAQAAAPKRIVALTPFAANTLAELGVKPVGVGQQAGGDERLSPKLKGATVLPLSHPDGPNLEQLVSLRPDLVLSGSIWAKGNEAMQGLGLRVVVSEPLRVNATFARTLQIGRLVGKLRQARELVAKDKKQVARARKGIAEHPKVMLILGVGHSPFTFLPNSWGGDVIAKAGGELLDGGLESGSGFQRISDEVVIAEDPEVLIVVPHGEPEDLSAIAEFFEHDPAWGSTRAAQEGHIYISTNNSLLQAGTNVAATIRQVRRLYLHNWPG